MLFPDPKICNNKINDYNKGISQNRTARDNCDYLTLFKLIGDEISDKNSTLISHNLIRMLGSFQAYRNQPAKRNLKFIDDLLNNQNVLRSFNRLIQARIKNNNLDDMLKNHNRAFKDAYNFTRENILMLPVGRIVTVSKALMMLIGINPALDQKNIERINEHMEIKIKPGQWSYNEFKEVLVFINNEIKKWEKQYNKFFASLENNMPVGVIMDKVLFM